MLEVADDLVVAFAEESVVVVVVVVREDGSTVEVGMDIVVDVGLVGAGVGVGRGSW